MDINLVLIDPSVIAVNDDVDLDPIRDPLEVTVKPEFSDIISSVKIKEEIGDIETNDIISIPESVHIEPRSEQNKIYSSKLSQTAYKFSYLYFNRTAEESEKQKFLLSQM